MSPKSALSVPLVMREFWVSLVNSWASPSQEFLVVPAPLVSILLDRGIRSILFNWPLIQAGLVSI